MEGVPGRVKRRGSWDPGRGRWAGTAIEVWEEQTDKKGGGGYEGTVRQLDGNKRGIHEVTRTSCFNDAHQEPPACSACSHPNVKSQWNLGDSSPLPPSHHSVPPHCLLIRAASLLAVPQSLP